MRIARKYHILPLLLALSSCRYGVELDVAQNSAGAPIRLSLRSLSRSFDACLSSASIYPLGRNQDVVWEAGTSDYDRCTQAISVGVPERGFEQRLHESPLPDGAYCAEVSGPGFTGWRRFIIRDKVAIQHSRAEGYC